MRNRPINPAFFQKPSDISAFNNLQQSKNSIKTKYKQARKQGTLNLSSCQPPLIELPVEVLSLETNLEADEKFWEIEPLKILDVSFNALQFLPVNFESFTEIHTMKLRSNRLTLLPAELFASCPLLRILDCGDNQIDTIADNIFQLTELRELSLNNNKIREFPLTLLRCSLLVSLQLQHNLLTSLPFLTFPQLTSLHLSANRLASLPDVHGLPRLETLAVSNNALSCLPSLQPLRQLKHLQAAHNQLTDLPSFASPSTLLSCVVGYNKLSSFPASLLPVASAAALSLQSPPPLTELSLTNNQISSLPPLVEALGKLTVLDLSNNSLSDLPPQLGYLPALSVLSLVGNPLRSIRQSLLVKNVEEIKKFLRTRGESLFGERGGERGERMGEKGGGEGAGGRREEVEYRARHSPPHSLDLSTLSLSSLSPEQFASLSPMLSSLSFSSLLLHKNQLRSLPVALLEERGVREGDLSHNLLGGPGGREEGERGERLSCPSLFSLTLSHNNIEERDLPSLLSPFPALLSLSLSHNPLLSLFPSSLPSLSSLQRLNLSFCSLSSFSLPSLPSLSELDLSSNSLSSLPASLPLSCPALTLLSLENNSLYEIPQFLLSLSLLRCLLIGGNPQRGVRPPIIAQGGERVVKYLRERHAPSLPSPLPPTFPPSAPPPLSSLSLSNPLPPQPVRGLGRESEREEEGRAGGVGGKGGVSPSPSSLLSLKEEMDSRSRREGLGSRGGGREALQRVNIKKREGKI